MKREWVLLHLKDAHEELRPIIEEFEKSDYDAGDNLVAMTHLYNHLNTAWNSKDASIEEVRTCSKGVFGEWRQFPLNSDMSVD